MPKPAIFLFSSVQSFQGHKLTFAEARLACNTAKLELSLDISLLEADDTLVIVDCALVSAKFAAAIDKLAEEIAELALNCTLVNVELASVTARFAIVRLEKADDVAMLALLTTTAIVDEAEPCADLMPLEAEIDAC